MRRHRAGNRNQGCGQRQGAGGAGDWQTRLQWVGRPGAEFGMAGGSRQQSRVTRLGVQGVGVSPP